MLQIACVLEGSGCMPVALKIWHKYCISFEKKLHLLFFMERLAILSFSNTMWMCVRCSCGVLLNMIISSKYAIANGKSFSIPVINSWKYAGACARPNGTFIYSYFPKGELKAVLGMDDLSRGMWW